MSDFLVEIQRESYARASAGLRANWPEEQALDGPGFADLIARHRYGVLATARPDGRAHASPIAYLAAEGAVWIGTVEGIRLRNLRATPWASLVVMEGDADEGEQGVPHRAFTAEGPVTLHEGDALARAYEPLHDAWTARGAHILDWAAALIELRPERVFSHASRALGA